MADQARMLAQIEKLIRKTFRLPEDFRRRYQPTRSRNSRSRSKSKKPVKHSIEDLPAKKSDVNPYTSSPWEGSRELSPRGQSSGMGFLVQQLIRSSDRLIALIDITDEQRQQEVKSYIHQRERMMCWLDRHPEEFSGDKSAEKEDAIDEQAQNELDSLQAITAQLLRELSALKIETADKQQRIDQLQMENDALAREALELDELWRLQSNRQQLQREKRLCCEAEVCSLKSLLRKISYYEDIEQYFWVLEEHSRMACSPTKVKNTKISEIKDGMEQKIMSHASEIGYALASSPHKSQSVRHEQEKMSEWLDFDICSKSRPF